MGVVAQIDSTCQSEPHMPEIQWSQQSGVITKDRIKQTSPTVPISLNKCRTFSNQNQTPSSKNSSRDLGQRKLQPGLSVRASYLAVICSLVLAIRSACDEGDSNAPMHPLQCPYPLVPLGSHCPRLGFLIMYWPLIQLKCTNIVTCSREEDNLDYHDEKSEWDYMLFNRFTWLLFYWSNAYGNNRMFPPKMLLLPFPVHLFP